MNYKNNYQKWPVKTGHGWAEALHSLLTTTPRGISCYHLPFTDEETGLVSTGTWPRAQGGEGQGQSLSAHLDCLGSSITAATSTSSCIRRSLTPCPWN